MTLDMTITLGNVLQIAATIVALFAAYVRIRERLITIETRLGPMWDDWLKRRHG